MDLNYVKKLIKLVSESQVDEIEIEEDGKKIRIAKASHNSTAVPGFQPSHGASPPQSILPLPQEAVLPPAPKESEAPAVKYHEIRSPIVGTFYRAPAPEAAPFVEIGSMVEPGKVLCIVEAMKLMNEIESDVKGKIVRVMVENGLPVEYDQVLFLVET
ncbi:MAG: acetyl-CoA carboxylase biotin carboxyl carrier protein [Ignavibacteriae bacterium]|nr:acetyl-CoA carboxylase biotin carboxyl carrier protein [Ignavibacteriota bacterium]